MLSRSIEGVVIFSRNENSKCKCCNGNHIYGRIIKIEPFQSVCQGITRESVSSFIDETLLIEPELEGKRVKVIIEVVK